MIDTDHLLGLLVAFAPLPTNLTCTYFMQSSFASKGSGLFCEQSSRVNMSNSGNVTSRIDQPSQS